MKLLDRLKKIFQRASVPEDARRVYAESRSTEELVAGLERLFGTNRMEYDRLYTELAAVSKAIAAQKDKVRSGGLSAIEEDVTLDDIEIRQEHQARLRGRLSVLKGNLLLHQRLIGTVQDAQVREMRGISEEDVDAIVEAAQDAVASYERDMKAGEAAEASPVEDEAAEAARRVERRRKLLGEDPVAAAEPAAVPRQTKADRSQEPE
ncbi:MAG TPA: hypothetical protein VN700_07915 [Vicinamibacterales bacterium]|nr:hypothetical protein [Vicinamibacterales bacterium]